MVREEEIRRKERSRWLDFFTKIRGEDERQDFLLKVLTIVAFQFALTVIYIAVVVSVDSIKDYMKDNKWIFWVSFALTMMILFSMLWFYQILRISPCNYIILFLFTCFYSGMITSITCLFEPESVLVSAILTLVMFVGLLFVALTTRRSFPIICALVIVSMFLLICSIILLIIYLDRWAVILISFVGLIFTSIYVLLDIDMITDKYGLTYDDYILASIQLYTDIIMIFVYILQILGNRN